ncbi:MAG: hypothetical protein NDJ90_00890 [Oligoflexia bacterium]|nr:hypothetical protein [Oligoflexia bacterium]
MPKRVVSRWVVAVFFITSAAHAASDRIDLPAGVIFPSNNAAITLNPSALGALAGSVLDASVGFGESQSARPAVSYANAGRGFGWGLGAQDLGRDATAEAGLGFSMGKLQLGLGAQSRLDDFSPGFTLGTRFGQASGLYLAAVAYDFTDSLEHLTGAIGYRGAAYQLELDITRTPSMTTGSAAVVFLPTSRVSLLIGDSFWLSPRTTLDDLDIFLGIDAWLSQSVAIYFLYHGMASPYRAGLQLTL